MRRFAAAVALAVALATGTASAGTVPTLDSYNVRVRARYVAEDACSILVVRDYRGGLTGSTYRCAGPDREVTP